MAALIQEFNHLGGANVQEHQKNFQIYSNKLAGLDEPQRLVVLDSLKAVHRQEEIFLTKLLLKFEQRDKIKELILHGDRILNKVITTHKPFIFRNEDVNYFMTDLLPNVSYVIRNRCLNNLVRTITRDDVGEELFTRVLERYGIRTAQTLLPVCNEAFIRGILTNYRVVLRERQLVTLHQRFGADFIDFYYAECSKYGLANQFGDHPHFALYLSTRDIASFCQLLKYGKPQIGKNGFKKFMKFKKDDVLQDPKKYLPFIKIKILYRLLTKEEFRTYFVNKLQKNVRDFDGYALREDIARLDVKDRGSFLAGVFQEKYGIDLYSHYSDKTGSRRTIDGHIRNLLSPEDMLKFEMEDDDRMEYLPPSKSFPLIKDRINLTSDMNSRCELVVKLFKSAKHYNDEKALIEALKYVNQRHKNEQSTIRYDVFEYIKSNYKIVELGADVWEHINEMIQIEYMIMVPHAWYFREMLEEVLNYKFKNGLDCSPDFRKYIKSGEYHYIYLPTRNKELHRWAIHQLPEVCKQLFPQEEAQKYWPKACLNQIHTWNRTNPKDKISYFKYPDLVDTAMQHYESVYYDDFAVGVLTFSTTDPEEKKFQDKFLDKYITKLASFTSAWVWLLKYRVEIITQHIDMFFEKCTNTYHIGKILYELHKMHYTPLPDIVRTKSLQLLKDSIESMERNDEVHKVEIGQRNVALMALSYHKDFMQIIDHDRFYPSGEAEIDVLDESFKETLRLREQVVECLRNRPCSREVLAVMLRFCFKDYFRVSLPVLTVVLYNLPEKDLVEPLKILQDRSVSVRKRALFFGTTLGTAQMHCEFLRYAGENEKNKSLQKFVFNRTFKNFCFVGSRQAWEILLEHFKFVFEKDHETHAMVFQFSLIPRVYLSLYIEKVWQFIGKRWENQHNKVINAINTDVMALLSDELCDDIIHFSLTHSKERLVSSDVDFIYLYLLSSGDKIDHRFDLVAGNARIVADENSQLDFKEFNRKSRNISFLYSDLCRRLVSKDDEEEITHLAEKKMLVNKLAQAFPNIPLPYNHLDYQLQIEVCRCFLDDANKMPELFIKLQRDVMEKHGDVMVAEYFNEFAVSQCDLLYSDEEHKLMFAQKLLELDNSAAVKLLAIKLMPSEYPCSDACALQFRNLLAKIEADSAPVVSMFVNRYLKNLHF